MPQSGGYGCSWASRMASSACLLPLQPPTATLAAAGEARTTEYCSYANLSIFISGWLRYQPPNIGSHNVGQTILQVRPKTLPIQEGFFIYNQLKNERKNSAAIAHRAHSFFKK